MGDGEEQLALIERVQAITAAFNLSMESGMEFMAATAPKYPTQKILGKVFTYQECYLELLRQERNGATWSKYFTAACKDNGLGPACLVCRICGKELSCINPSDTLKTHPNSSSCKRSSPSSPEEEQPIISMRSSSAQVQTRLPLALADNDMLQPGLGGRRAVTHNRLLVKDLVQPTARGKAFLDALHNCSNKLQEAEDPRGDRWNEDTQQYVRQDTRYGSKALTLGYEHTDRLTPALGPVTDELVGSGNDVVDGDGDAPGSGGGVMSGSPQEGEAPAAKRARGDSTTAPTDMNNRLGARTVLNLATPQKTDDEEDEGDPGPVGGDGTGEGALESGSQGDGFEGGRGRGRRGGGTGVLVSQGLDLMRPVPSVRGWATGVRGRGRGGTRGGGRWGRGAGRGRGGLDINGSMSLDGTPLSTPGLGTGVHASPVVLGMGFGSSGGAPTPVLTRGAAAAAAANGRVPGVHHGVGDAGDAEVMAARGRAAVAAAGVPGGVGLSSAKVVQSNNQTCHLVMGPEDHIGATVAPILGRLVQHLVEDSMFGNEASFNKLLQLCKVLPFGARQGLGSGGGDDAAAMLSALGAAGAADGAAGPSGSAGVDDAAVAAAAGAAAGAGSDGGDLNVDNTEVINVNMID